MSIQSIILESIINYSFFIILIAPLLFCFLIRIRRSEFGWWFYIKYYFIGVIFFFSVLILNQYIPNFFILGDLNLMSIYILFIFIFGAQYLTLIIINIIPPEKTAIILGVAAGCIRSLLAVGTLAPICKEHPEYSRYAATSVMFANTILVLRNFLFVLFIGWQLGVFILYDYFIIPMLILIVLCGLVTFVLWFGAKKIGELKVKVFSFKSIAKLIILFIILRIIGNLIYIFAGKGGFYIVSFAAGFVFGFAFFLSMITSFVSGALPLNVMLVSTLLITISAICSDIVYAKIEGANKLTKLLLLTEIPIAIISMLSLSYMLGWIVF